MNNYRVKWLNLVLVMVSIETDKHFWYITSKFKEVLISNPYFETAVKTRVANWMIILFDIVSKLVYWYDT